jgi:predicted metal-dependent HD superfamily phosphohydrolase
MIKKNDEILEAFVPFYLHKRTGERVSSKILPKYNGQSKLEEIDRAYEILENAKTSEAFYKAVAILVFHSRHLHPIQHANLAKLIFRPFQRRAGRPESIELRAAIEDFVFWRSLKNLNRQSINSDNDKLSKHTDKERSEIIARLAQRFKTSKKVVNRILNEIENDTNTLK